MTANSDLLPGLREALETLITYAEEVMQWHADPESSDYNQCDEDKCLWCEDVSKAIRALKQAIKAQA
jgi:hypothetical protein